MERYVIKKVLNNSVILVENQDYKYILVGKGIGFGKRKNDTLENFNNIEEKFISLEGLGKNEYENFLETIDPKIIELSKEIIELIQTNLNEKFNSKVQVGLIDHINFSVKRLKEGIEIINPFLSETKILYPEEYSIAEKAVEILEENLDINIPDAEIGFLTLHIYGGRKNKNKKQALEHSMITNKILKLLEDKLDIKIDRESFICKRFVMHIIGVLNRTANNKTYENILLPKLEKELEKEIDLACKISKIIKDVLNLEVPESEVGYIALHIHKIRNV